MTARRVGLLPLGVGGWRREVVILSIVLIPLSATAQQKDAYDYWQSQRVMVRRGQQALMMCNGLFTSGRTFEQVFAQELRFIPSPVGTPAGGAYEIDRQRRAVAVGIDAPVMRAAFREGLGCVVLAPDQTFDDIGALPELRLPPPAGDPRTTPWPDGDLVAPAEASADIDTAALQAASDWAFTRPSPEQVTLSLLVVHGGRIVHERYVPGVDMFTRTRTWSVAKSLAVTLMGMLVDRGQLSLDAPLALDWLPTATGPDPRSAITLRHLLNMSSGLETVDNGGLEYATGSGLGYWAGASSVKGALSRGLIRQPGTHWDYENSDTLIAVLAMKQALGSQESYLNFPRTALFDRIGMRNTVAATDRFGDYVLSSQVYTSARDLARFGLLYLNGGTWRGERLISQAWIDFVRTPAPATLTTGKEYGGQWWLVPDTRHDVPADAYAAQGNRGQYVIVVPTHDLVIVRRGLDYGKQGFDPWDLTREVLKAVRPIASR
jgi:CubicO group peptidase (beta-lactamase class C family)